MNFEIPYGKGKQILTVPEKRILQSLTPKHACVGVEGEEALVLKALQSPIGSARLKELAQGKKKIVLITSDHTRPLPSRITLPPILDEIRQGSPDADITILVATGMHRAPTNEEMRDKFGDALLEKERLVIHDAQEDREMAFFGVLPSGGELWLNHLILAADLVVSEGFIEPHFFAGFSGGRKSILPGVAARRTVLYNHNAQFIANPRARQGSLTGNPIHMDMAYAAKAAGLQFILNVLLDGDKRVIAAFGGDSEMAHQAGCSMCDAMARVPHATADIVVTSNGGYPLDQNLYQAVKGLTAAEACVRQGGVIVMCAALFDGHGGEAFYRWFADSMNAQAVAQEIENIPPSDTRLDQWQAQILARVLKKADCIFVTGPENRQMIENMHMHWAAHVNDALETATRLIGRDDAMVTVIPDGVNVIVNEQG